MKVITMILTAIHYTFSSISWLLGTLVLVLNVIGAWALWNASGFLFILFVPILIPSFILAFGFACNDRNKKMIILNLCILAFSIAFTLFTVFVSAGWFW